MSWKRFFVAVFAALLLLPSISLAQSVVTGGISGVVTDPSGSVIVGATVSLKNNATGESQSSDDGVDRHIPIHAPEAGQLMLCPQRSRDLNRPPRVWTCCSVR